MTQNAVNEKEANKKRLEARAADMDKREAELNASRTGKGKRIFLAMTRGKNPQEIQFEAFDESKPDTLPETVAEFLQLSGVKGEKEAVRRLIAGDYEIAYTEASDPVAEFIESNWDEDTRNRFRVSVRNYALNAECSIEEAVQLIEPGVQKAFDKRSAPAPTA